MMAQEAPPADTPSFPCHNLDENMAQFVMSPRFADVQFVIGDAKIWGHRVILASRSSYFDSILSESEVRPCPQEIALDVPLAAFESCLTFVYLGHVRIPRDAQLVADILRLVREFFLGALEAFLSDHSESFLDTLNVCGILDAAISYNFQELKKKCLRCIERHTEEIVKNAAPLTLSQPALIAVLTCQHSLSEIDIFDVVSKWCQNNTDTDNLVKSCVTLSNFSRNDLLKIVWPSRLFEESQLLSVLSNSENDGNLILDENIAASCQVISGDQSDSHFASHGVNGSIIVKLDQIYMINHIRMTLADHEKRYFIEMSRDRKNWVRVIDHCDFPCRSLQNLYFSQRETQFIKIEGTDEFEIVSFGAFFKNDTPSIVNGIVRPKCNVATLERGAICIEGNDPEGILNGDPNNSPSWHRMGKDYITIQLAQPFVISSVKLYFGYVQSAKYRIETSVDKVNWDVAVDKSDQFYTMWQEDTFLERPVVFIRIVGLTRKLSLLSKFYCYHFECM